MRPLVLCLLLCGILAPALHAAQSSITEADGSACMGDDRSRKQTEQAALTDAKKRAVEFVATYLRSETEVKNFVAEKDLLAAYAHAEVKVLQELEKAWYKDPSSGDCYKVRVRAEVVPDVKAMERMSAANPSAMDDPSGPLTVKAWTDRKTYKEGEKIRVFLKGNKPFYARVLYKDAGGATVQLLPNPHRSDNYFNGGAVYEIPSGGDRFDLEVGPPFGEERIIVYASTSPLGEIGVKADGDVYQVVTASRDIGTKTRGIKLKGRPDGTSGAASEFVESSVAVSTGKQGHGPL